MGSRPLTLYETTVGKKCVMAVSGAVMFAFVMAHMLGNLQIFVGPEAVNRYAELLRSTPTVLWGVRAVLVVAAAVHVVTAIGLTWRAWEARPVGYARRRYVATGLGARSMPYGGLALLLFVGYHLAHLTAGYAWGLGYQHPPLDAQGRPDVYQNVVASFRVGWCAGAYLLAQLCLALHLQHGAWSVLQSLGLSHPRYNESLRSAAAAIALGACVGFAAVPVAVYFGLVPVE